LSASLLRDATVRNIPEEYTLVIFLTPLQKLRYFAGILLEGLMKTTKELRIRSSTPVYVTVTRWQPLVAAIGTSQLR
jgi:hypothetical protein